MTNDQLADLLEEAARQLRNNSSAHFSASIVRRGMSTAELAETTGVHPNTILRMVRKKELPATPIGGSHGYEFADSAVSRVEAILKMRHKERKVLRRKATR